MKNKKAYIAQLSHEKIFIKERWGCCDRGSVFWKAIHLLRRIRFNFFIIQNIEGKTAVISEIVDKGLLIMFSFGEPITST